MSFQPAHEQELLAALMGRADERRRARAALHAAGHSDELAALATGLARAADELRDAANPGERAEARLVARVLRSTTRADPSWRGDLRLACDFLRARLRASPALRLVAASLVLHAVAGPALAWWMLRERTPEKRFTIHVERPSEEPFAPAPPPPAPEADELLRLARAREARANALARTRYLLLTHGPAAPELAPEPGAARASALLAARARFLRAPALAPELGPVPGPDEPLALALWLELALDQLALTGQGAAELGPASLALCERGTAQGGTETPGTRHLAAAACARAAGLGVLAAAPQGFAGAPLDAAWFEALARAGEESGLGASTAWQAWMAFGAELRAVSVR